MSEQQLFNIDEMSRVAEARRLITAFAPDLGFDTTDIGKLAIAITEAATNLVKHAQGGQLVIRLLPGTGQAGLEMLALDRGPGLVNLNQALHDGYSTAGSAGTGLGAIMRLATVFDIHSLPGRGTALLAQFWKANKAPSSAQSPQLEIGVVCLPKTGQAVSGDNWGIRQQDGCSLVMVADGLGHGPQAAEASTLAVEVLAANGYRPPAALVEAAHEALFHTRGAALAVAELDLTQQRVKFAGVGNITGAILGLDRNHYLTSMNGIIGHQFRKVQEFSYPWSADAVLILHSDGLTAHWNLQSYPGLLNRHPGLIAGVLYRDFCRNHDDVTVIVAKQK